MGARVSTLAIVIASMFLVWTTSEVALANPIAAPPFDNYRPSIEIGSDGQFTADHGVIGGSGTAADPYIVADCEFVVGSYNNIGLYIHETRAYFVVQDILVRNIAETYETQGILIDDVKNGQIRDCWTAGADTGISVRRSEGIDVFESEIAGASNAGIDLTLCHDSVIQGNLIDECVMGIVITDAYDVLVQNNVVTQADTGVALHDSSGIVVERNTINGTEDAYSDDSWTGNVWPGNTRVIDQTAGKVVLYCVLLPAMGALGLVALAARRWRKRPEAA